ncbi:hypothetical protein KFL_002130075 [Klebsormidium nitens]|uniref:Uncharacterized protein n=1 Tax=Klebsormidium nitens TaxID=105231 RepID=A0A1Y1I715_KLENI|nr:hypothetical protein KFL_002130075 [Klebsormidium nitens]|eukprot:GAQ84931.1 hypothetical protein KFL_002130075 [Klebsormidium nitens]
MDFLELPRRAWRPYDFPDPRRLFPGANLAPPAQPFVPPTKTAFGHTRSAHYFFLHLNPFALNHRAAESVVFFPFVLLTCIALPIYLSPR